MAKEQPPPNSYLVPGYEWLYDEPDEIELGRLRPDAPAEAHLVQAISWRLRMEFSDQEDKDWTMRGIAKECKMHHLVVRDLWHGSAWPTLRTIASLEIGMKGTIWGPEHRLPSKRKTPRQSP